MSRSEHEFQFKASDIATAATAEAEYHRRRLQHWRDEYDNAVEIVKDTIGAKLVEHPITGGYTVDVVVDYGDPAAWKRCQQAFQKITIHERAAERYEIDAKLYGTQGDVVYLLSGDDVAHWRLGGQEREL